MNSIDALYAEHKKFGRYITRQQLLQGIKRYTTWQINPALSFAAVTALVIVGAAGFMLAGHGQNTALSKTTSQTTTTTSTKSSSSLNAQNQLAPTGGAASSSAGVSSNGTAVAPGGVAGSAPTAGLTAPIQSAIGSPVTSCDQTLKQQYTNIYNQQKQSLGLESLLQLNTTLAQITTNYLAELQAIRCPL